MLNFRPFLLFMLALLCVTSWEECFASEREYAIKAGFLFNFARYSQGEWFSERPEMSGQTENKYVICSFSSDFSGTVARMLNGQKVHGAPVVSRLVGPLSDNLSECNTLFVDKYNYVAWAHVLNSSRLSKTMLVGEFDNFISSGGHIRFFNIGGKVRFELSPKKLKQAGIQMSSKVLRMGRIYEGDEQ